MKKRIIPFLTALALTATMGLASCGENGKSAYDLWLDAGNSGTVEEFLESLKGQDGAKGDKGDKGDQGEQGIQGEKGDKGDQGDKGDKGDQGEQGIQGEKGETGDKGDQGDKGETGDKGDKGDQGDKGETGDKGDKGDQGEPGAPGAPGETGNGIANIVIVEKEDGNYWKITYTNGEFVELLIPGTAVGDEEEVVCEHENVTKLASLEGSVATCVKEGEAIFYCADCDDIVILGVGVDADNHIWDEAAYTDPTCTADGFWTCACGETKIDEDSMLDHNWVDETYTAPTCTADGFWTCECGAVKTDEGTKLPHNYDYEGGKVVTAPTCDADGYTTYNCKDCDSAEGDYVGDTTAKLGHNYQWVTVHEPSESICISGGHHINICLTCSDLKEVEDLPGQGHNYVADSAEVTVYPTEEATGMMTVQCSVCGTVEVELPALTDTAYTKSVTTTATCLVAEVAEYTYTATAEISGSTITVVFEIEGDKLNHVNAAGKEMPLDGTYKPADVDTVFGNTPESCDPTAPAGTGAFECKECHISYIVSVRGECKAEDKVEDTSKYVAPSCQAEGKKVYVCKVCGTETTETLAKLDHVYTFNKVIPNGAETTVFWTCNGVGCDTCGDTKSQVVSDWTLAEEVDPTCSAEGYKKYTYNYVSLTGEEVVGENGVTSIVGDIVYCEHIDPIAKVGHTYNDYVFSTDTSKVYEWSELLDIFDANDDGEITEAEGLKMFGNSPTSCSETGFGSFDCVYCHTSFLISMTGDHEWVKGETTAPTCDAEGYTVYTCSKDATHTKQDDKVAAIGHKMIYDRTDKETQTIYFKCEHECGKTDSIVAKSWKPIRLEPTCCADGYEYIEYIYEENGVDVTKTTAPVTLPKTPNVHTYAAGVTFNWNDEHSYSELIAKYGIDTDDDGVNDALDETKWTIFGNAGATCKDKGYVSFKCTVCGEDALITIVGDHAYEHVIEKANCTTDGKQYDKCTVCGNIANETVIAAREHTLPAKPVMKVQATAEQDGLYVVECSCEANELYEACDLYEEIVVPAWNAETWEADGWKYSKEGSTKPTCKADGKDKYFYIVRSKLIEGVEMPSYFLTVPAGEHEGVEPPVEQTWTYNGYVYTGYYCGVCEMMIVTSKVPV